MKLCSKCETKKAVSEFAINAANLAVKTTGVNHADQITIK